MKSSKVFNVSVLCFQTFPSKVELFRRKRSVFLIKAVNKIESLQVELSYSYIFRQCIDFLCLGYLAHVIVLRPCVAEEL